jgi:hypothetical protein
MAGILVILTENGREMGCEREYLTIFKYRSLNIMLSIGRTNLHLFNAKPMLKSRAV